MIDIYVPSYRRAGNVKLFDYLGDKIILCIHTQEEEEYKKAYPNNKLIILPDRTKGNMAKVRNYIKDNAKTENFVMMDDDVKGIYRMQNRKPKLLTVDQFYSFLEVGFIMAREINTVLWGVNLNADPMSYREFEPFLLKSPVLGPMSCHVRKSISLRYDERLSLNEDYDYFLQVINKYRKVLRFQGYHYRIGEFLVTKGGCSEERTFKKEIDQMKTMEKKWGDIVRYDVAKKKFNPQIRIPF